MRGTRPTTSESRRRATGSWSSAAAARGWNASSATGAGSGWSTTRARATRSGSSRAARRSRSAGSFRTTARRCWFNSCGERSVPRSGPEGNGQITKNGRSGRMKLERAAGIAASAAWLGAWSSAAAAIEDLPGGPKRWGLNLQDPATSIAADQHWIHWFVLWICVAIFVAVFGTMLWSIIHHRKSKGHQAAEFHESTATEGAWTIVPFLIVVAIAVPATKMVVDQKDTASADVTVKATGYQW